MSTSFEMRWFLEGKIPTEIKDWYEQETYQRENIDDKYLISSACSSFGIKLRNGRLEIKEKTAEGIVINITDTIQGKLERWKKTVFGLFPNLSEINQETAGWTTVHKIRKIKHYRFEAPGEIKLVSNGQQPPTGCRLELAQIKINHSDWWTIIFEMSGEENIITEDFSKALKSILGILNLEQLNNENSYSYPEWLTKYNNNEFA